MKKNKAFTLVEILAVIIILGLISGIAMVSVSRYRAKALEDEKKSIRGSINDAFNNYRVTTTVKKTTDRQNPNSIPLSSFTFDKSVKFNGKLCDLDESSVYYIVRGDFGVNHSSANITKKNQNDEFKSKAEDICIKLVCDNETIIDDQSDGTSLCNPNYTVTENSGE